MLWLLLLVVLTVITLGLAAGLVLPTSPVAGLVAVLAACALAHLLLPLVVLVSASLLGSFFVFLVLFVVEGALPALIVFGLLVSAESVLLVLVHVWIRKSTDMVLQAQIIFGCSNLCHLENQLDQAVSVQGRVVLLAESQRTLLPVRHLLAFAYHLFKQLLSDLGEARLLDKADLLEVFLEVDKVGEIFEKLHPRKIPSKHFKIALKAESNTSRVFVRKNLTECLVKHVAVGQGNQVDQVSCSLVAQL